MSESKPKTILVVDDDPDIRSLIVMVLKTASYTVVTAENGTKALEIVDSDTAVDLILMDVMMPGMDGFETLNAVRAQGINTPVIMLTARSTDADIIKGYQVGADYYIPKPFKNATLLNIVNYLVGDLPEEERKRLERQI